MDLQERTYVVTGANTGIGRAPAQGLAQRGARVRLACRSESKTTPVVEAIRAQTGNTHVDFVPLDLGDLESVKACAEVFLARGEPLDGLINNAGLGGQGQTADGFELHFGVNYLGHFLLTLRLVPLLARAPGVARIVNVSSHAHRDVRAFDFESVREPTRSFMGAREYCLSKLANVLFTRSLAARLRERGIHAYALHPGVVATDMWRRVPAWIAWFPKMFLLSPAQGARTTLHCALSEEAGSETGLYYDRCAAREPSQLALDDTLADELWQRSLAWTATADIV